MYQKAFGYDKGDFCKNNSLLFERISDMYDFRADSSLHTKKLYDTNQCEGWNCGNIASANSLVKERCRERVRSNASPSLAS